jgi:NAD+-dependent protein deacetylase sirtuin 4
VRGIVTQNVDGLHQAAGSRRVLDLHGSLYDVRCLTCGDQSSRDQMQHRLLTLNPSFERRLSRTSGFEAPSAPDGDAELLQGTPADFQIPGCLQCGGLLKPDVVFFGENVPPDRVARAWSLFDEAEVLLVLGTSLTVFSGRRFVLRAARNGIPIVLINLGPTRSDSEVTLKVETRVGEVLPELFDALRAHALPPSPLIELVEPPCA